MVCTANVGRSPLLAALLQEHADQRLGSGVVSVGSAGVDAPAGAQAAEGSRRVAAGSGISLDGHRATPARFAPLDDALLIITMTRRHRRILTSYRDTLAPRTFALRELLAAVEAIGEFDEVVTDAKTPQERLQAVVAAADERRPRTRLRRSFDIPDPIGGGEEAYRALGEEFGDATASLADPLFGRTCG